MNKLMPYNRYFKIFLLSFLPFQLLAQKGMPAEEIVTVSITTNYPQHIDFKPPMVKELKVAAGWKISVAATGLGKPRMLAIGNKGELYITRRDAGDVLLLKDLDGDHKFDELKTVVADFKGVHGIVIRDRWLYLCSNHDLKRYQLEDDGTVKNIEHLINDLPDGGQHGNRTIAFGSDSMLYISVGSTCNDCGETNKESATLLQVDPGTWERTVYARGLRNMIGFDWEPETDQLYGMDNGGDTKGDDFPPEELNRIVKNMDYGWPLVYGKRVVDKTREDPAGTTKEAYAKRTQPSVMEFPAHMAPIAFQFFKNTNSASLPEGYSGDALVCWHGSWNKKNPDGFKVQRILFENGKPTGSKDFVSGFLSADGRKRFGRPAGLAISPEGIVYFSDDANGNIYCVEQVK